MVTDEQLERLVGDISVVLRGAQRGFYGTPSVTHSLASAAQDMAFAILREAPLGSPDSRLALDLAAVGEKLERFVAKAKTRRRPWAEQAIRTKG